jgi:hypothetical protein
MSVTLSVIDELGINLYSNLPAVLAEIVANAYDADATRVELAIDAEAGTIEISDDGHGMNQSELNGRFLKVGYRRREKQPGPTPKGRLPMGRKGIGKLALFAIASEIEIHTAKMAEDGVSIEKAGCILRESEVRAAAGADNTYYPTPVDESRLADGIGTRICLREVKKDLRRATSWLRRRLARRFALAAGRDGMEIVLDGQAVTVADRMYFGRLQAVRWYGTPPDGDLSEATTRGVTQEDGDAHISSEGDDLRVTGWLGFVNDVRSLVDEGEDLNRVVVMSRHKLVQEDVLATVGKRGLYTKYVMGELHADFLDEDGIDRFTSNRQQIREDDPRYAAVLDFVKRELTAVYRLWRRLRQEQARDELPDAVRDWLLELPSEHRAQAQAFFGRLNETLATEEPADRQRFYLNAALAFEGLRRKRRLDQLAQVDAAHVELLAELLNDLDDIEAALYHQVVSQRLEVIKVLRQHRDSNVLERVVQEHLFTHLWLLDPSWERVPVSQFMEQTAETIFRDVNAELSPDERQARVDITYTRTADRHLIIELKRPGRSVSQGEITDQVRKYQRAFRKKLAAMGSSAPYVEAVCVLGSWPKDWEEPADRGEGMEALRQQHIRVVLFDELLENASRAYQDYTEQQTAASRLFGVVAALLAAGDEAAGAAMADDVVDAEADAESASEHQSV